jgi:uncharacterized membrane protein
LYLHGIPQGIASWDGFSLCLIVLIWRSVRRADAVRIRHVATSEDPGRTWLFVAVVTAATASLLAVGALLGGLKGMKGGMLALHVLLSVGGVLGAWLLLHVLFTLRYAHVYFGENYRTPEQDQAGGLDFPGAEPCSYWDFAYFAFVIGMTAQTADIDVTSVQMRRLVLLHGVLSFFYNTAVVALSINILSGIL